MVTAFQKKAFLYFGAAFVILLGGAIILMAPYHAVGYVSEGNDAFTFELWDMEGYYPQLELLLSARASANVTYVEINMAIVNNDTLETTFINLTLTLDDVIPNSNPPVFEHRSVLDLGYGNFTIYVGRLVNVDMLDLGLTQATNSRVYVVTGGSLNVMGLIMGCAGWLYVRGDFLPTSEGTIIDWGYDSRTMKSARGTPTHDEATSTVPGRERRREDRDDIQ